MRGAAEIGELEPRERNPVAIRRTVWALVVIALASAVFISVSYQKLLKRQAQEFRPPMEGALQENLAMKLLDGSVVSMDALFGRVWVAWLVALPPQGEDFKVIHQARLEALKSMREIRDVEGNQVQELVFLLGADPEVDDAELVSEWNRALEVLGLPEDAWAVRAGSEVMLDFLFTEMRAGLKPELRGQNWHYDERVIVGEGRTAEGKQHHLRGSFDFEKAREMDLEAKEAGREGGFEELLLERFEKTLRTLLAEGPAAESPKK